MSPEPIYAPVRIKCLHNTMSQLEPRPLDPESSMLSSAYYIFLQIKLGQRSEAKDGQYLATEKIKYQTCLIKTLPTLITVGFLVIFASAQKLLMFGIWLPLK